MKIKILALLLLLAAGDVWAQSLPTGGGSGTGGTGCNTSGASMLKGDGAGGCANATSGTDYLTKGDVTGGASTFDQLGTGSNTTATMTVGTGASLGFAGIGTIDANRWKGATTISTSDLPATIDLSAKTATAPIKAGLASATPSTCIASKEFYVKTDATAGQQLFLCNGAGNGFVLVGDGTGAGGTVIGTGTNTEVSYFTGSGTIASTALLKIVGGVLHTGDTGSKWSENIQTNSPVGATQLVYPNAATINLMGSNIANAYTAGAKQTFLSSASIAGLNIGSYSGQPSSPASGDLNNNAGVIQFFTGGSWKTIPFTDTAVVTTGSPANGNLAKFSGSSSVTNADLTGDVTTAGTMAATIATGAINNAKLGANAVDSAKMAAVNTRRKCELIIGNTASTTVIADADLGPQIDACMVEGASTIFEVQVRANTGTPNIIVGKRTVGGSASNIVNAALATGSSGARACSKTSATTSTIDGSTSCSGTLQNTSLGLGDSIELVSGTAGGAAKYMRVTVWYTIN